MAKKQNTESPYMKACKVLCIEPRPELADRSNPGLVSEDGYHRLRICIEAKNMLDGKIWRPIYVGSETHYWPYFKQTPSGLGFTITSCGYWFTSTNVGPRLEYRSRELATQGAKEFIKYYNDFFNNSNN